jgi:hypothetical protein
MPIEAKKALLDIGACVVISIPMMAIGPFFQWVTDDPSAHEGGLVLGMMISAILFWPYFRWSRNRLSGTPHREGP